MLHGGAGVASLIERQQTDSVKAEHYDFKI